MRVKNLLLSALVGLVVASEAKAGISIEPYVSVRSTKGIKATKDKSKEKETVKQRQEAGLKGGLSFFSLLNLQLGVGQSKLTTTEKTQDVKDEYNEINYKQDLNMSTDEADKEIKITETQNVARFSVILDPSFWIFILRAKVGVTAQQRIITTEESGKDKQRLVHGPTYKPHSGLGVGVKLGAGMYCMAEYGFYHYKFPEIEPFEREVSISVAVSIGK